MIHSISFRANILGEIIALFITVGADSLHVAIVSTFIVKIFHYKTFFTRENLNITWLVFLFKLRFSFHILFLVLLLCHDYNVLL